MMRLALLALLVATSCKRGTEPKAEVSEETRPGPERGSAGGFSASLSADLEVRGGAAAKGSGDFFSDVAGTGSGSADSKPAGADSKAGSAGDEKAGSADLKAGSASDTKPASTETKPASTDTKAAGSATISLEVDVQSKNVKETFKFHYGYEDPKAPADREAFKKHLASAKILNVTTDRQRGAAWYLEGTDGRGGTAFRLIVTWGGKRLFCGGSSYKSNELGDIRDEVVVQAKKICETVAL